MLYLCDMNDYVELKFELSPCCEDATDVLAALLCDYGYESFVPNENGLTAYIKKELYKKDDVTSVISEFPFDCKIKHQDNVIEGQDWNSEWEKNYFQPIVVDDKCVIHSSFHKDFPQGLPYDIVIDPKMAFGTGHHSTTSLIIEQLLDMNLTNKSVIDMGTGTGILAILAAMRGANPITAIEIDPMAHINAVDNVKLNGVPQINVWLGDASLLPNVDNVDVFIANINRNIIVEDIAAYSTCLNIGGIMLLSGFYESDIPVVEKAANEVGLCYKSHTVDKEWTCLKLTKQ